MTDTVSSGGARPPGRRAWVLEFRLVFCTVSGLAQSFLWSLTFALGLIASPCPDCGQEGMGGACSPFPAVRRGWGPRLVLPQGRLSVLCLCSEPGGGLGGDSGVHGAGGYPQLVPAQILRQVGYFGRGATCCSRKRPVSP